MARCARIVLPGVPMHIVQRGNNRQRCFQQDADQRYFLRCLSEYLPDSGCAIHAYALMTNHVHLLLTPAALDSVFMLMKPVSQKYSQYFNRKYERIGTLWQGRYRSSTVETERYLLVCHRYIEMNPVRAGMVSEPKDYPWSSYKSNALGAEDPLLSPHPLYVSLGTSESERLAAYRKLFLSNLSDMQLDAIRDATNGNGVLGGADFSEYVSGVSGRHPNRRRRYRDPGQGEVRP
jgi:putative transposase